MANRTHLYKLNAVCATPISAGVMCNSTPALARALRPQLYSEHPRERERGRTRQQQQLSSRSAKYNLRGQIAGRRRLSPASKFARPHIERALTPPPLASPFVCACYYRARYCEGALLARALPSLASLSRVGVLLCESRSRQPCLY